MSKNNKIPDKKTGAAHFFAAATYSYSGFKRMCGEAAFRHEACAGVAVLAVYFFIGASCVQIVAACILMLATAAVEALNTGLEEIVDLVSPQWSQAAKNAKDLGSFAVMCMLVANVLLAVFVACSVM